MKIGIIGAGGIGQAFAGHAVRAGYKVLLSNSRGPESLAGIVAELGVNAKAVTPQEAATADIIFLSVRWPQVRAALAELPSLEGRILIDATNGIGDPNFDGKRDSSSEIVASLVPGARVVKACNTLHRVVLASSPDAGGGKRVLFVSGDIEEAKIAVKDILETCGFAVIDLGGLATGGRLQQLPGGPLPGLNLVSLDTHASDSDKTNVRLWYEAFSQRVPELIDRIVDPAWVDTPAPSGQPPGPAGLKKIYEELTGAFPDLTIEVRDVLQDGNKVTVRSEISGTQRQPFMGHEPTGAKLHIQAIDIHEFRAGKIVGTWHTEDWLSGLHQIGVLKS
ncbi:MAG: ester cyclase [Arenimonas sp.]